MTARRYLVIASFPPVRCGVADYAEAQARSLEEGGAAVTRWNIAVELGAESALPRPNRKLMTLARASASADEIWIHYQSSLLQDTRLRPALLAHVSPHLLLAAVLAPHRTKTTMIVHELNTHVYPWASRRVQQGVACALFHASGTLAFHTAHEEQEFRRQYYAPSRTIRVSPGAFYDRRIDEDHASARIRLGLDQSSLLFVCIGFFHPAKGFREFAEAFAAAKRSGALPEKAQLDVVTSVRSGNKSLESELASFQQRAASLPGVRVRSGYVDDADFDRWLVAADWIGVPYRTGYTSSVAARAALFATPCILSTYGAMAEIGTPQDRRYSSDAELSEIFCSIGRMS